jgi:hypothetical protein
MSGDDAKEAGLASFIAESDRQRMAERERRLTQAANLLTTSASDYPVSFELDEDDESTCPRETYDRARRVASALAVGFDGRPYGYSAESIRRVTFRPYPSKSPGFWRVEVGFVRDFHCAGSEWYVDGSRLFRAWAEQETTHGADR